ncbi:MAG: M1 family metallopeptidase [Candidatus Microsaccharimonas sp.]
MQTVSRLIEYFVPEHYTLSLTLGRQDRTFSGTVTINGTSTYGTNKLGLHAKDLVIESVLFDGKKAEFTQNDDDELYITHKDLVAGKHVITVSFSGKITDPMHGLYPCYFEHDGIKKQLLATQFESHHAREVFPCIDEPEAKATYDVTLTTETGVTVLGNMPIKLQREENEQLVTSFETTPRMSTYLLAFVVGELHKKSATTKSGVEVNVWATLAQPSNSLNFALDIATRTIDFFDEYFDTPYPLPKSDNVALPDFSSAAMENWGLVTYREVALLADPKTTSLANKHQAATIITHELSHQWFGNLVTMKWWNDLWLNESFANIMEYVAVDALHPEWDIWLDHASYEVPGALRRDSLLGIQSIQADVNHPDEIGALFDPSIVYAKGGRTIRMLETYIGKEAFRKGLRLYFQKFAYQNTQASDLWDCLSETSGQDIGLFMHSWISQSGYPVIHVSRVGTKVTLTQEQFFIGPREASDKLWPIPLNSTCSEMPKILNEKQITVTCHHDTPLRFNTGGTAHFITHYSPEILAQILGSLDELSDIDRMQLLHEQTLLAQAGILSSVELIGLLDFYRDETVEAVWGIMAIAINELKRFVETDLEAEKKLRQFVGELAKRQFDRLGWDAVEGEPEADTKLRSLIISLMLYSEQQDIIDEAMRRYETTPINDLDPEIRTSLMGASVRYSTDQKIIDSLLAAHKKTSSSELQEDIASALTSTKDPAVIDRLIELFKDTSVIRPQDFPRWFVWLLRNRYGRTVVWQWTQDNWDWIENLYKGDSHFDAVPRYIASSLITPTQLAEYTAFFTPLKKLPALRRNIEIGIGELTGKVELTERDGPAVRKALLEL